MLVPQTTLAVKDVCQQLKCSKESIYRYFKAGKFPHAFRLADRLRFVQQDIDDYMQRHSLRNQIIA